MHARRNSVGFTLVELLVVLAMIALLVALVRPLYSAAVPGARVRTEILDLAVSLRQSRNRAISSGKVIAVEFDTEHARYAIGPDITELPASTRLFAVQRGMNPVQLIATDDPIVRLEFHPDGSSTGASVELRNTSASWQLDVDWLTGRVRVTQRDPDAS
jgi:general secretion pathway protein H